MCDLSSCCIFDSGSIDRAVSTCSLADPSSGGQRLWISVQRDAGEVLIVYDLEQYFGKRPIKRPDRLLIGQVESGLGVVVFVELKSQTGWDESVEKFRAVLPAFGRGGGEGSEGEHHHQECKHLLPDGKDHQVIALVVGRVGSEYVKSGRRGNRRPAERERAALSYGGKPVPVVPPLAGRQFNSVRDFWKHLGLLPR